MEDKITALELVDALGVNTHRITVKPVRDAMACKVTGVEAYIEPHGCYHYIVEGKGKTLAEAMEQLEKEIPKLYEKCPVCGVIERKNILEVRGCITDHVIFKSLKEKIIDGCPAGEPICDNCHWLRECTETRRKELVINQIKGGGR